jgi:hypothetical protein
MGIDVFFAGLMLICLKDQPNCPAGGYGNDNTAWVVKADGESKPCGWDSKAKTALVIQFDRDKFKYIPGGTLDCASGACIVPETPGADLCVSADPNEASRRETTLGRLPVLDSMDERFLAINPDRLKDETKVPFRLHFNSGILGASSYWPSDGNPTLWLRSNGREDGALPRNLSERLRVSYEGARSFQVKKCGDETNFLIRLELRPGMNTGQVTLLNRGSGLQAEGDKVGDNDVLTYLIWYYRLGVWKTADGDCPQYTSTKKDATLLSCRHSRLRCFDTSAGEGGTIYWPTMLRPGF